MEFFASPLLEVPGSSPGIRAGRRPLPPGEYYSRREMMEQVTSRAPKGTGQLLRMLPGSGSEDESSQDFWLLAPPVHQQPGQQVSGNAPAPWLPPAQLHPEVLCLWPVWEKAACCSGAYSSLRVCLTASISSARDDHAVKCSERGSALPPSFNGGLTAQEAFAPAHQPGPGQCLLSAPRDPGKECKAHLRLNCAWTALLGLSHRCAPKCQGGGQACAKGAVRPEQGVAKKVAEAAAKELLPRYSPSAQRKAPLSFEAGAALPLTEHLADCFDLSGGFQMDLERFY